MAGTVVLSSQRSEGVIRWARFLATGDAANGSFPPVTLRSLNVHIDGTIIGIETNPGTTAPTDNYDITLVDPDGLDRLGGAGLDRDTATTEYAAVGRSSAPDETLTLTWANNSVNSATIELIIYWSASAAVGSGSSSSAGSVLFRGFSSPTLSNVASSASTGTILATNSSRVGATIVNDSTATLYLKYGATASTTSYTYQVPPGATWEMPLPAYLGIIDGIWSAANGNARCTDYA